MKNFLNISALVLIGIFIFSGLQTSAVIAETSKEAIQGGAEQVAGAPGNSTKGINNTITGVITILSVIAGIVAVVMLIVGGYKYMTSGGDANKVSSAKSTVLYELLG